jgi:8-oxo-dGTP pyrophosphatase MutT (NUDIX family)
VTHPFPVEPDGGRAGAREVSDELRDRLRSTLSSHVPADEREALSLAIVEVELERLVLPFDRGSDATHVTASAVVVGERGVVLHRHRSLHRWLQPGGHVEPGESPAQAALRESIEETGLAATHPAAGPTFVHVDVHEAARGHIHLDMRYLLTAPADDPAPGPDESQDVAWFSWDAADDVADESLAGALRSARSLIGTAGGGTAHPE